MPKLTDLNKIFLTGTAHINAKGNSLDNTLIGNSGNNTLEGEDGDDYFVHLSGIGPKLQKFGLREGQQVVFDVDYDHKGDKAINVRPV